MFFYTSYPYAAFAAHAINCLPDPETDGFKCCSHECAPCGGLRMLYESGHLSMAVTPYLTKAGYSVDWWDRRTNTVKWGWIQSRMCNPNTCENKDLDEDED